MDKHIQPALQSPEVSILRSDPYLLSYLSGTTGGDIAGSVIDIFSPLSIFSDFVDLQTVVMDAVEESTAPAQTVDIKAATTYHRE